MSEKKTLNDIQSPSQLKDLSMEEMNDIAGEIRELIIQTVSQNGGHLASNLGVVELTLAIHQVFDAPNDKIVWDVGHQCYAHKILTGRMEQIHTIRTENGISGFPKISESDYDAFNAGHSSTSISAAYGMKCASHLQGKESYTVAVIGDGALTGGLAFEGLNNAGQSKENFIIILNDNKMSISQNVGSIAAYLKSVRIAPSYLNAKSRVQHVLSKVPLLGKPMTKGIKNIKKFIRTKVQKEHNTLFEDLGYVYYGPFDGHSIPQLIKTLNAAKRIKGPVLVHVLTQKGKGYIHAEKNPKNYHGIYSFDIKTGESHKSGIGFSDVFGQTLCSFAETDDRICAITAAMQLGTGLSDFARQYKERFFDVGIAEEHAVTFAAGLATAGIIPVFAVYSTFLQRAYDQIIHDAAMQEHHIVLAVDRAGLVGEDGETHQGIFDVSFLNTIPNVTVFCPAYYSELQQMLETALFHTDNVAVVRYPRGSESQIPQGYVYDSSADFSLFGDKEQNDILIVTYGRLFGYACQAAEALKEKGISVCILKLNKIKPLNEDAVFAALPFNNIFFFEEGISNGGVGEHFSFKLLTSGYKGKFTLNAIDDIYVPQATVASSLHRLKFDSDGMVEVICDTLKKR